MCTSPHLVSGLRLDCRPNADRNNTTANTRLKLYLRSRQAKPSQAKPSQAAQHNGDGGGGGAERGLRQIRIVAASTSLKPVCDDNGGRVLQAQSFS